MPPVEFHWRTKTIVLLQTEYRELVSVLFQITKNCGYPTQMCSVMILYGSDVILRKNSHQINNGSLSVGDIQWFVQYLEIKELKLSMGFYGLPAYCEDVLFCLARKFLHKAGGIKYIAYTLLLYEIYGKREAFISNAVAKM